MTERLWLTGDVETDQQITDDDLVPPNPDLAGPSS